MTAAVEQKAQLGGRETAPLPRGPQSVEKGHAQDFVQAPIPDEMKRLDQWVCWRSEERNGKQTKVPVNPKTGNRGKVNNPAALAGTRWVETGMVFTTTIGTMLDQRNLLKAFYRILQTSEVPRIRFHDLRHSAATLLLAQGVHPRVVMDLLGHSSIAVTPDTYSHVIPDLQRESASKMDAILNRVASTVASSAPQKRVQ